ncbi:MAG: helix-turn-helix transcriptional regulator [Clostridia bacterium]|nr:helix-turn-helix transcriptional regulator [Clostridia bacterium]
MPRCTAIFAFSANSSGVFAPANREVYEEIFKNLVKHYNALAECEDVILQSLVLELVYTIFKDSGETVKHSATNGNRAIEKALEYIKDHLTESLTLERVSKAAALSPIHFHNLFKKSVGKTLREYVEEQRIKKATGLLLTTNDSLTKIAFECGFSSQSHFSFVFKRKMKLTPREYVKEVYAKYGI